MKQKFNGAARHTAGRSKPAQRKQDRKPKAQFVLFPESKTGVFDYFRNITQLVKQDPTQFGHFVGHWSRLSRHDWTAVELTVIFHKIGHLLDELCERGQKAEAEELVYFLNNKPEGLVRWYGKAALVMPHFKGRQIAQCMSGTVRFVEHGVHANPDFMFELSRVGAAPGVVNHADDLTVAKSFAAAGQLTRWRMPLDREFIQRLGHRVANGINVGSDLADRVTKARETLGL